MLVTYGVGLLWGRCSEGHHDSNAVRCVQSLVCFAARVPSPVREASYTYMEALGLMFPDDVLATGA